ncbi:alpha/beta hydrolase domain-containing protein [Pseudofrankia inefficax]|uniref:Alpha/beta hydrolase domain-containing protein n=1 Tax=Pseudofrankia inefficax (strain DSM 45817 / CECT 9037 / DDB 130130 / EuI1c) TaxID=298654 RepID=E3IV67_PSEI1|nr:alpha/beta hydrolase domain-containing protein [Pseudofrankia inefficax]ADP80087.1 hypothetical protein FraEuI1c_2037 [Pseudofrankia inefficax]
MAVSGIRRRPGERTPIGRLLRGRPGTRVATLACLAVLGLATACGGSGGGGTASPAATTTGPASATRTTPRVAGPAAAFSPLTGGNGVFIGAPTPENVSAGGYVEQEFAAAGTASSYKTDGAVNGDGRWRFVPDANAPYRTRVLVRRPTDPKKFSGTVVLEWLNVSGGVDADPEWTSLHEELMRAGDIWVGVSAQLIGVSGGAVAVTLPGANTVAGKGLKAIDPARYGSLQHPGDGFAFDIFTQVARAVGAGAGTAGQAPKRLIAAGESQSAFAMVTYYNGVQPLTHEFDGFLVHSRGKAGLPLAAPGKYADIAGSLSGVTTIMRTDQDAPVLDIQTESDVTGILNAYPARQPDTDRFRDWEVTGTAHADAHLVGPNASTLDCGLPINNGPMHVVAKAALRALVHWVTTGTVPVTAPRFDVDDSTGTPQIRRDGDGIAIGGIRTPPVEVPVAALSGATGPNPSVICLLLGSTKPLPASRIAALYPSRADYQRRYDAATTAAIKAGFVLPEDRAAMAAFADPAVVQG